MTDTTNIDPHTRRPFGDHGDANDAIEWALDHAPAFDEVSFLRCWREGNLGEWPEFYAWLKENGR